MGPKNSLMATAYRKTAWADAQGGPTQLVGEVRGRSMSTSGRISTER